MTLLVILGIALLGCGVALVAHGWFASSSSGTSQTLAQIDSYGFTAPAAREVGAAPTEPVSSPSGPGLAAQVGGFAQNFLGVGEHGIRRELLAAGMYTTDPLTIIGYRLFATVGAVAVWLWFALTTDRSFLILVVGGALLGVAGWMLPVLIVRRRGRRRTERIDYELPELIDLLVVTLEAGLSFLASLHMAAERLEGPLGTELRLTLQEQRMGLGINDALEGMLRRCETPSLRTFVRSVIQGENLGVSTGQIMRNLAVEMRKRRRAMAEERAQKAPVKMLFPLIFLIFPAMFVVLLGPAMYSIAKIFDSTG
jgi:tight adherence protein C